MKQLLVLVACFTAALCQDEETRHASFYGAYYKPTYYYQPPPPPPRYAYLSQECCSDPAIQQQSCRVYQTWFGFSYCKCCMRDAAAVAAVTAASATCSTTTSTVTTQSTVATTPSTAATTPTTAATTTPTTAATTTPTTAATTTAQALSCPNSVCSIRRRRRGAYDFMSNLRLQGGTTVTSICTYPGAVSVEATSPAGVLTVCTGALISSTEVQIPSNCAQTLALAAATNDQAVVNGVRIPISSVSTATPLAIATLSTAVDITAAPAQACIYTSSMGAYDKSTCEIVGFGVDASNSNGGVAQTAPVTFDATACANINQALVVSGASYGCAKMTNAAACAGDGGALIMCDLVNTGEKVVIGQAETFDCDVNNPAVYFQNFDV